MKKNWIDFKGLRASLDFGQVLRHYKVEVKRKGDQHHGFCPLPNHNGNKNTPSFSANLNRGIFQCFGCGAKGNVLDFAVLMENLDPKNGEDLLAIALKLQERFVPASVKADQRPEKALPEPRLPVVINAPLDFELKGLIANHPYLLARKFSLETIAHFGIGFCSRGMLKDRIAIPLHDHRGKLVGYAGRVVDDKLITDQNPRYRLPGKRERGGELHEFRKTLFLYNGYRIQDPVDDLVVVEGFTGVWWLHQLRIPWVVGTMGADCSDEQAALVVQLLKPSGRLWIMPDGNEAGERLAQAVFRQVSPHRFVRWVKLESDKQPTNLTGEQLKASLIL